MAEQGCQVCGHRFDGLEAACPLCRVPAPGAEVSPLDAGARDLEGVVRGADRPVPRAVAPLRGRLAGPGLQGTVLQTHGPTMVPGSRDGWRLGSTVLLATALLPLLLSVLALLTAARLALGIAGLRLGGGRGLLGEIMTFHLLGNAFQRPEPLPIYDHVVDTGSGLVSARQEGEFQDGRIFVGNRVRLHGNDRNGALVIEEGFNESLGTQLSFRPSPWRPAFFLLVLLIAGGLVALTTMAPGTVVR